MEKSTRFRGDEKKEPEKPKLRCLFCEHFETYIHLVNDTHRENCPSNVGKGSSITIQWWFVSLWCVHISVFSSLQKSITECAYGEMDTLGGWNWIDTHAYDWPSTSWDNEKRKQQITRAQNKQKNKRMRMKMRRTRGKNAGKEWGKNDTNYQWETHACNQ